MAKARSKSAHEKLHREQLQAREAAEKRAEALVHARAAERERAARIAAAAPRSPSPPPLPKEPPAPERGDALLYANTYFHRNHQPPIPVEAAAAVQETDTRAAAENIENSKEDFSQLQDEKRKRDEQARLRASAAASQLKFTQEVGRLEYDLKAWEREETRLQQLAVPHPALRILQDCETQLNESRRQARLSESCKQAQLERLVETTCMLPAAAPSATAADLIGRMAASLAPLGKTQSVDGPNSKEGLAEPGIAVPADAHKRFQYREHVEPASTLPASVAPIATAPEQKRESPIEPATEDNRAALSEPFAPAQPPAHQPGHSSEPKTDQLVRPTSSASPRPARKPAPQPTFQADPAFTPYRAPNSHADVAATAKPLPPLPSVHAEDLPPNPSQQQSSWPPQPRQPLQQSQHMPLPHVSGPGMEKLRATIAAQRARAALHASAGRVSSAGAGISQAEWRAFLFEDDGPQRAAARPIQPSKIHSGGSNALSPHVVHRVGPAVLHDDHATYAAEGPQRVHAHHAVGSTPSREDRFPSVEAPDMLDDDSLSVHSLTSLITDPGAPGGELFDNSFATPRPGGLVHQSPMTTPRPPRLATSPARSPFQASPSHRPSAPEMVIGPASQSLSRQPDDEWQQLLSPEHDDIRHSARTAAQLSQPQPDEGWVVPPRVHDDADLAELHQRIARLETAIHDLPAVNLHEAVLDGSRRGAHAAAGANTNVAQSAQPGDPDVGIDYFLSHRHEEHPSVDVPPVWREPSDETEMSLQDAFRRHKQEFLARAQERQDTVRATARARSSAPPHPAIAQALAYLQKRKVVSESKPEAGPRLAASTDSGASSARPRLSKDEIRDVNTRLYNALCPEVRAREEDTRKRAAADRNRTRARQFREELHQRLKSNKM
eukprot:m.28595 g.28595  ORF g.28595 m.28595 type:complete len:894 (+) comp4568_c0_seq2:3856-6537(+)